MVQVEMSTIEASTPVRAVDGHYVLALQWVPRDRATSSSKSLHSLTCSPCDPDPERAMTRRYIWANLVYIAYCSVVMVVNYMADPQYSSDSAIAAADILANGNSSFSKATLEAIAKANEDLNFVNELYIVAASMHVFNAFQYYIIW